jgi:flagellar biosynthesis protein FlhF
LPSFSITPKAIAKGKRMEVRSYRAGTLGEALQLVREELGPDAAVIETKEVRSRCWRGIFGRRQIVVTASTDVEVASHFANDASANFTPFAPDPRDIAPSAPECVPPIDQMSFRERFRRDLALSVSSNSELDQINDTTERQMPEAVFRVFAGLVDAEVPEEVAQELIANVRSSGESLDEGVLRQKILRCVEDGLNIGGPIQVTPGDRRVVALVGPTGVGKTTTIAKLAANFRLRDNHKVGLITVDTYRIAAVDQLRTYADIIDLPMEVVSTPREMRDAVCRLSHLDLILMDTAGRSPRDELKLQELKTMISEAGADEVHLVLSATAGAHSLKKLARCFAEVGTTALTLTKLDEATGLGNLLPLLRGCELPLSYLTNGQNVPDDIFVADRQNLAASALGLKPILR